MICCSVCRKRQKGEFYIIDVKGEDHCLRRWFSFFRGRKRRCRLLRTGFLYDIMDRRKTIGGGKKRVMASIHLTKVIEKFKWENLTPEIDISKIKVMQPDINRPALQLAGYFEHFETTRLQIVGFVEYSYMNGLDEERQREIFEKLLNNPLPGILFCRDLNPNPIFREIAVKYGVPLLMSKKATSACTAEVIRWLNVKLAPCISVHGVLVDVYGEGVLITGESGIGKSEAALELIKRGHRLVTDDVVASACKVRRILSIRTFGRDGSIIT